MTGVCIVCGSSNVKYLFTARDKIFYRDQTKHPVVKCRDCGLVFLSPQPSSYEKSKHYDDEYAFSASHPENEQKIFHYQPVIDYLRNREPGRLLDIGTGNSPLLPTMRKNGWEVAGTEVNSELVDYFRYKHQIEVFEGELKDAHFEDKSFDAITILGVIEHVSNPRVLLDEVSRILKDDGVLALWCFNRGLEAKILGRYWLGFDAPRHVYSFSYETLERLLVDTGFEVKGSLFRPISYASYSGVWAYDRMRNWFRDKEDRKPTFRLELPKPLELAGRQLGKVMASRKSSSNMFLFTGKAGATSEMNSEKESQSVGKHGIQV